MHVFILREGLMGPLFSDRARMARHCEVWAAALGKGDLLAPGTEVESDGGINLNRLARRVPRRHHVHRVRHGIHAMHHQFTETSSDIIANTFDGMNISNRTRPNQLTGFWIVPWELKGSAIMVPTAP